MSSLRGMQPSSKTSSRPSSSSHCSPVCDEAELPDDRQRRLVVGRDARDDSRDALRARRRDQPTRGVLRVAAAAVLREDRVADLHRVRQRRPVDAGRGRESPHGRRARRLARPRARSTPGPRSRRATDPRRRRKRVSCSSGQSRGDAHAERTLRVLVTALPRARASSPPSSSCSSISAPSRLLRARRLNSLRLAGHLREVRRVRRLADTIGLLALDPLQQDAEVADGVVDPRVQVAEPQRSAAATSRS